MADLEAAGRRFAALLQSPESEPWLDKRGLAAHLACSVRWIEARMAEGLPYAVIGGRAKFRASEIEPWLEAHGHLDRRVAA